MHNIHMFNVVSRKENKTWHDTFVVLFSGYRYILLTVYHIYIKIFKLNGEIVSLWSFHYFLTRIKVGLNKNCDIIRILILGGCIAVDCGGTSHPQNTFVKLQNNIFLQRRIHSWKLAPLEGISKYGKKKGGGSQQCVYFR